MKSSKGMFTCRVAPCKRSSRFCVTVLLSLVILLFFVVHAGYLKSRVVQITSTVKHTETIAEDVRHVEATAVIPVPVEVNIENVPQQAFRFKSYSEALSSQADSESKAVLLAFADMGGFPMAMNFYLTSIQRYDVRNVLFVSSSEEFCSRFQAIEVACFVYMNESAHDKASVYLSKDFINKMNIRTYMILEALQLGYHVIHSDVDVVFFKDPTERIFDLCHFKDPEKACDVAPLWDSGAHNAGFLFIRNSNASISLYKKMEHTAKTTKIDDQKALNRAMGSLKKKLRVTSLPGAEFQSGNKFFDISHRQFAGDHPCTNCIVMHNNWIVSMEAKVYRFKEMHMWLYDQDEYYSSAQRRYLVYQNPTYFGNDSTTLAAERSSLVTALTIGLILNRTVILPKFFCAKKAQKCTILQHYLLRIFDQSFASSYREHTFLLNELVPLTVRNSSRLTCALLNATEEIPSLGDKVFRYNESQEIRQETIEKWFGNETNSVLEFHSLYNVPRIVLKNATADEEFKGKCEKAFVKAKRHQF
ncbi:hypothetical protein CAPTEDRAFT_193488 [Capitella teleta]|uniref:Nucleotide-diphospho-sugar transferase domain-containing protein n=1 Tax=Capitella teleta TaxID=283909 RepID=R7TU81_CAPTE|nr:hypothetical protein CAPTEDRAFT_193488 [Capitella teleta]|eukprot:ELT97152.1 hypothetical protein CAPTEDRAFT_193488 [Capitella teleta]